MTTSTHHSDFGEIFLKQDAGGGASDDCAKTGNARCIDEVFANWESAPHSPAAIFHEAQYMNVFKPPRADISRGLFDPQLPLSHFDKVAEQVFRSGRPIGKQGIREIVEKAWGDQEFNPDHANHTTIIELRGQEPGKLMRSTESRVNTETNDAADLGVNHARFGMRSHDVQKPEFIQGVLDYIDKETAKGNKVLMHCFHGTDRTGVIAAAYELSHQKELTALLKDNPNEALKRALDSMTANGFDSKKMPEMAKSIEDYVTWKNKQLK